MRFAEARIAWRGRQGQLPCLIDRKMCRELIEMRIEFGVKLPRHVLPEQATQVNYRSFQVL